MMLIICDKHPYLAGKFLIEYTNKNFVFKQLLELCQLICSAGISNIYKKIPQGKELQEWVKNNPHWVSRYMAKLIRFSQDNVNLKKDTECKITHIYCDLLNYTPKFTDRIDDAIFRYKQGYKSKYETNTLLPINIAVNEYRKYITKYKFPQEK